MVVCEEGGNTASPNATRLGGAALRQVEQGASRGKPVVTFFALICRVDRCVSR